MDVFIFMLCMIVVVNFPVRVFIRTPRTNLPCSTPVEDFSLEKRHVFCYHPGCTLYINCFINKDNERKYFLSNDRDDLFKSEIDNQDFKSITNEFRKILNNIKIENYKNKLFYELFYVYYHTHGGNLNPRKIRFFEKYELMPKAEHKDFKKNAPLFTIFIRKSRKRYYTTAAFRFSLDEYYGGDMELTELTRLLEGFLRVFGNDFDED